MRAAGREFVGLIVLAVALIGLLAGSRVTAAVVGDDDDLVDDVPFREGPAPGFQVVIRNVETNVDAWVYGNRRNSVGGRKQLDWLLKTKADQVARATGLTESQKQKLLLA